MEFARDVSNLIALDYGDITYFDCLCGREGLFLVPEGNEIEVCDRCGKRYKGSWVTRIYVLED